MQQNNSFPIIIVNPKSAGGQTSNSWARIASDLSESFGVFNVAFTESAGDGERLAHKFAEEGRKFIIACGGDGTINEVANGILTSGKDVELGILPSGTGGDFRRSLDLPTSTNDAGKVLRNGVTKRIDVGKVTFLNHQNEQISRFFMNVTSFGLSATVVENVKTTARLDWMPKGILKGKLSFALAGLQGLTKSGATKVIIKIDKNREREIETLNFCIANGKFFGGGMKIAPDALIDDGSFDVVNIGDITKLRVLRHGYKLYNGTHTNLSEVGHTLARRIEASPAGNEEIHLEIDGELPGKLPATFEIIPNALRIRVPL